MLPAPTRPSLLITKDPLTLDPVVGPDLPPIVIEPGTPGPVILGRSSSCSVVLPEESVSRRHARIESVGEAWVISDLGSRHGTHVNAVRLEANAPAPLRAGDLVGIGPWTFRVRTGGALSEGHVTTTDDAADRRERVRRIASDELAAITHNRLSLILEVAGAVAGAPDEASLARAVLKAAVEGSGFPRAALLRELSADRPAEELRVVAEVGPAGRAEAGAPAPPTTFSRSLIAAARSGEVACLTADAPLPGAAPGHSVHSLQIRTAICAPITLGPTVAAYLYLDARAGETGGARAFRAGFTDGGSVNQDAAAFCLALSRLYGLALANISRAELEKRQRELLQELSAAREAQRLIVPPEEGVVGGLRYAFRMQSGRYVAGDLFDILPVGEGSDGRVAVFLGDVAGKGIGAAILMATAQTYLNAALRADPDPARALAQVNRYICEHAPANKFISLWLGVFDPRAGLLRYVDAGHGHWLLLTPGAEPRRVIAANGIPLGIDPDFPYRADELPVRPGNRLVVFSDGVVEQPDAEGVMLGLDRAVAALAPSAGVHDDVRRLFEAVFAHAGAESLADDTTVASIGCAPA